MLHPTEIRTSISPSSAVELHTTSALANYATEAGLMTINLPSNCDSTTDILKEFSAKKGQAIGVDIYLDNGAIPSCFTTCSRIEYSTIVSCLESRHRRRHVSRLKDDARVNTFQIMVSDDYE
uniref:(California timema) hypothetical protein n=1 Tax=Timema californicum TaxID=61474 RepID=A0A7R9PAZ3_TIMCA|nr:unnamed protein product [Timema californicum]